MTVWLLLSSLYSLDSFYPTLQYLIILTVCKFVDITQLFWQSATVLIICNWLESLLLSWQSANVLFYFTLFAPDKFLLNCCMLRPNHRKVGKQGGRTRLGRIVISFSPKWFYELRQINSGPKLRGSLVYLIQLMKPIAEKGIEFFFLHIPCPWDLKGYIVNWCFLLSWIISFLLLLFFLVVVVVVFFFISTRKHPILDIPDAALKLCYICQCTNLWISQFLEIREKKYRKFYFLDNAMKPSLVTEQVRRMRPDT